jgi:hypothetical protein
VSQSMSDRTRGSSPWFALNPHIYRASEYVLSIGLVWDRVGFSTKYSCEPLVPPRNQRFQRSYERISGSTLVPPMVEAELWNLRWFQRSWVVLEWNQKIAHRENRS